MLGGGQKEIGTKIMKLLKEKNASDVSVVIGGIIQETDKPLLEGIGISGFYGPGTSVAKIIDHVVQRVDARKAGD